MLGCTCLISNVVSDELGFMRAQPSPGELTRQGCAAALTVNRSMQKLCVEGGDGELNILVVLSNSSPILKKIFYY